MNRMCFGERTIRTQNRKAVNIGQPKWSYLRVSYQKRLLFSLPIVVIGQGVTNGHNRESKINIRPLLRVYIMAQ